MRRFTIGLALGALLLAAGPAGAADTGDTGNDTGSERDTDPYLDTGAVSEEVYVQDVGCAALPRASWPGAAIAALGLCATVVRRRGARSASPPIARGPLP